MEAHGGRVVRRSNEKGLEANFTSLSRACNLQDRVEYFPRRPFPFPCDSALSLSLIDACVCFTLQTSIQANLGLQPTDAASTPLAALLGPAAAAQAGLVRGSSSGVSSEGAEGLGYSSVLHLPAAAVARARRRPPRP